jgi:hypothetical protein
MMKGMLLGLAMLLCLNAAAQRLSFSQLEVLLGQPIIAAEESLFLAGYSFASKDSVPEKQMSLYTFTNGKNTIGSAKRVVKASFNQSNKSSVKYVTYDRSEFQSFRKLMVNEQFIRSGKDEISENSNYSKKDLNVQFEVSKDKYDNQVYYITLRSDKLEKEKVAKKISLKNLLKQSEE